MVTKYFRGDALAVAQVNTVTPATITVGNDFTVTINSKSITFRATAATVANVTAGLVAAIAASTIPEFLEVTATDSTTHVTLTATTAGKPFIQTSSAAVGAGTGTPTNTTATTTVSSGPNHWDTLANWSDGALPANTDTVIVENSNVDILYGLAQSAVTLTLLDIKASYTGKIGLPRHNGSYYEYRDQYLAISTTTLKVGDGTGDGSGRIKINTGSVQTSVTCLYTAASAEQGVESFIWKGTHASNTVQVTRGNMGVAIFTSETATIATLKVGYQQSVQSDASVRCGSGTSLTTIDKSGGLLAISSDCTTIIQTDGTLKAIGDGIDVTTVKNEGGTFQYASNGVIGTLITANNAVSDFNGDLRAKTVTTCERHGHTSTIIDDFRTVTWTNGVRLIHTETDSQYLRLGTNIQLNVTAL